MIKKKKRVLSGIQPSGDLHLGNYFGMMSKMIEYQAKNELFCFIADYHALTTVKDAELMGKYRQTIAATWLSFFDGQKNCSFYFQSDIPEIMELAWILSCVTAKGLMNRAHAYKAAVAINGEQGIS